MKLTYFLSPDYLIRIWFHERHSFARACTNPRIIFNVFPFLLSTSILSIYSILIRFLFPTPSFRPSHASTTSTTSTIATSTSTHSLAHSNKKHQCWNSIQETHQLPHPPTVNQKAGKGRTRIQTLQIDYLHRRKSKETAGDVRVQICYKERKSHREIIAPNLWEADHQGEYREMGLDIVSVWDERRRARKLRM